MRFNVSMLKDCVRCPSLAYYTHVLRRGLPEKPVALDVGTLWHKCMDMMYNPTKRTPLPEIHALFGDMALRNEVSEDAFDEWTHTLYPVASAWQMPEDIAVLATEERMEIPFTSIPHMLEGTLDTILDWNGKVWHGQYKTAHASTPPGVYSELQRTDWHECAYHAMLAEKYGWDNVGGTILILVRKLSRKAVESSPLAGISIHYLARPRELVESALYDMEDVAERFMQDMDVYQSCGQVLAKYPQACGGIFGNRLCQYRDVCFNNKDINDAPFVTLPERYPSAATLDS